MANVYSSGIGDAFQGVPMDNVRRLFNFGDRIAELAPMESPFFVYLSKVAKRPTDDPVFKFLEQRHQWQRRNMIVGDVVAAGNIAADATVQVKFVTHYDKFGRDLEGINHDDAATSGSADSGYSAPQFPIVNQIIAVKCSTGTDAGIHRFLVTAVADSTIDDFAGDTSTDSVACKQLTLKNIGTATINVGFADPVVSTLTEGDAAQVIGSAFAEATGAPEGWVDALYNREGYCQIFKTAIPLFSGSVMATRYRGIANEYTRVWREKLMEHKMDIEQNTLFGVGRYVGAEDGTNPKRYTWGILPYTESYGKVYNFSYGASNYDNFLDAMEDFYAPESGNSRDKLVLTSRKILSWLQKLNNPGFLKNTLTAENFRLDVQNIKGSFGHEVTKVRTIFGNLHFVEEPLLRGMFEDYAIAVDMRNVAYRTLAGNGISRDTHVITNVQNNDTDGRKDLILTEAGLEINLPETHAILKWA